MPGAGEMYLGFMKMGVSLMGLFFGIIVFCALLNLPSLLTVGVVVWFYSFFHVHNLVGLTDEEFRNVEDDFLFHPGLFSSAKKDVEKYRKACGSLIHCCRYSAFMEWDEVSVYALDSGLYFFNFKPV